MDIGPPELIILVVVILLMFGGSQIPKLARNLGRAQHEFKSAFEEGQRGDKPTETPTESVEAASVVDAVPTPHRIDS